MSESERRVDNVAAPSTRITVNREEDRLPYRPAITVTTRASVPELMGRESTESETGEADK